MTRDQLNTAVLWANGVGAVVNLAFAVHSAMGYAVPPGGWQLNAIGVLIGIVGWHVALRIRRRNRGDCQITAVAS